MSEVKKCKCEFCLNSFDKKVMVGVLCNNCHSNTKLCCECKGRFEKDEINSNGACDDCDDRELCEGDCGEKFNKDDLLNGKCDTCHELDPTPTSEECDQCDRPAVRNIAGTNLCKDCLEHYHY